MLNMLIKLLTLNFALFCAVLFLMLGNTLKSIVKFIQNFSYRYILFLLNPEVYENIYKHQANLDQIYFSYTRI